jgi:hypothetical protein
MVKIALSNGSAQMGTFPSVQLASISGDITRELGVFDKKTTSNIQNSYRADGRKVAIALLRVPMIPSLQLH